ncbi:MAG: M23 family metallopeptidase, partial [Clostridiales bacterium]|nr:M23 family metallopeptidase [Clostridiales bacterium]
QSALDQQTDNYQKELDSFSQKALDLQQALDELSKDKETILNELHRISFLPPLAEEVASSAPIQPLAMSVSTPAESSLDTNLEAQFTYLSDLLDVQQAAFSQLTSEIQDMKPIISNYPTIWPVKGRLTSPFGYRQNPLGSGSEFHSGLDIAVPTGTEIVATGGGSVTFAGSQGGYGNLVIIQHGMGLETYYGHNSKLLVKTGDTVVRGQIIARSGNTGSSTGPHLHYEVKKDGTAVNPEQYLP